VPRPTYPSDEARKKNKPAARVHTSITNHPKYAAVFADRDLRSIVVGLWVKGVEKFISKTGDTLTMTASDVCWITGTERGVDAAKLLRRACEAMAYRPRVSCDRHARCPRSSCQRPAIWTVYIRNFSKKQGLTPQRAESRAETTPTPHPSESYSESNSIPRSSSAESNGHDPIEKSFTEFWLIKPRRDGTNSRAKAFTAFVRAVQGYVERVRGVAVKHPAVLPDTIVAGARKWRSAVERRGELDTKYVLMASSWLNQRGWEQQDEEPEAEKPRIIA
jgi:hypothetical protein